MTEPIPKVIALFAHPLVATFGFPSAIIALGIAIKFLLERFTLREKHFYSGMDLTWAALGITLGKLTAIAQTYVSLAKDKSAVEAKIASSAIASQVDLFSVIGYLFLWFLFFLFVFALHSAYEKPDSELAKEIFREKFETCPNEDNKKVLMGRASFRRKIALCGIANFVGAASLYLYNSIIGA
jgi:hypothetical protein